MNTILSFKITFQAILQIFLLGSFGFALVKKNLITDEDLSFLSCLVIKFTLPLFIFCQLIEHFNFSNYQNWWFFPILSLIITAVGFLVGRLILVFYKNMPYKKEFLSLLGFQNSGYLPLILVATILPTSQKEAMFIYLFLFLLGFNLVIWSLGVRFLLKTKGKSLKLINEILSPPVLAILISLFLIMLGLNKFLPQFILKPLKLLGDCTLPLAMLVVGAGLAKIKIFKPNKIAISLLVFGKLIFLPFLALVILFLFKVDPMVGFLILLQAAMPSATSLSLIARHHRLEEEFINQGIFITHVISLITIPLFLGIYGKFVILF
ncbi:MAG: AEC family transporter [Candidatus Omnitrophota bacterium]|nr:AEC family transporter [Candidatus Omnitrophota bacterium]